MAALGLYGLVAVFAAGPLAALDRRLARTLRSLPLDRITEGVLRAASGTADGVRPYLLVAAASIGLLRLGRRREAARLAAAPAAGGVLTACLKALHGRPRPIGPARRLGGYPSGHVVFAVVFSGTLCGLRAAAPGRRRRAALAAAATGAMALSRIRSGAHWPSDALGGLLAGLFCLACVGGLFGDRRRGSEFPKAGVVS